MTLATQSSHGVYCANAFYAFAREEATLIFSSDTTTRHGAEMVANPKVAASIVLETRTVGRIQGVQIVGRVVEAAESDRGVYISKFPYTAPLSLCLWRLEIDELKLTDNTLGFGRKIVWNRE